MSPRPSPPHPFPRRAPTAILAFAATCAGCQLSVPSPLRKVDDAQLENLPAVVTAPSEARQAAAARAQINPRKNATVPTR